MRAVHVYRPMSEPMQKRTIVILNPNTSTRTTGAMVEIARQTIGELDRDGVLSVRGITAPFGPDMIIDAPALVRSADAVAQMIADLETEAGGPPAAVIVSAFGDPGMEAAERRFPGRAFGIGAAGMLEAAREGRAFAIATTTPGLEDSIDKRAASLGLGGQYRGVYLTRTPPLELAGAQEQLQEELAEAVARAIEDGGAEAVVIGGGPLAIAARALAPRFGIALIEPIPAAVRSAVAALDRAVGRG
jgi:allantoin racemase